MTIAIDIGNGSLKVAVVTDGQVRRSDSVATASLDVASLASLLAALHGTPGRDAPIAVVSVVPSATAVVRDAVARVDGRMLLADGTTIPIPARVAEPARVGADRLLGAWGARERYGAPVIVVDLGTATTVDVVDADGAFAGGAILPGIELGLTALARATALLPEVQLAPPAAALARDTVQSLRSGAVLGHLGAIREVVTRIVAELVPEGPRPRVVATGGVTRNEWATRLLSEPAGPSLPPIVDVVDPDHLFRSLHRLASRGEVLA